MVVTYLTLTRLSHKFYLGNDIACLCKLQLRRNIVLQRNLSDLRSVTMAFTSYGDDNLSEKVPIVVMHGLFGSKANWYSLGKVMAKETQKKVFLVDARNHGDSPHTDEHTYFHLAEDINNFFSVHNIERAAVIGHSMGGRAMMAFALQHPQKIDSLTVVDISPVNTPKSMDNMKHIFKAMESIEPIISESLSVARHTAEKKLRAGLGSKDLSSFLSMNIGEENGMFTWKINLKSLIKNYVDNIATFPIKSGEFNGPTLFICGEKSDFVNFQDVDKILKFFPKASFVKIENAGHWVHYEQPTAFAEVACNFIKSSKI